MTFPSFTRAFAAVMAAALFLSAPAIAAPVHATPAQEGPRSRPADTGKAPVTDRVPGEIVVSFEPGLGRAAIAHARRAVGAHLDRRIGPRTELIRVPKRDFTSALAALNDSPLVDYAEPNFIYTIDAIVPSDSHFGEQWALDNTGQSGGTVDADIDAPEAWGATTGSTDVVVAVVDTGVAYDHPDLSPNAWVNPGEVAGNGLDDDQNGYVDDVTGWDFVSSDARPFDLNGHGTHAAGTIAARGNNDTLVSGVAWQAGIMSVRALNSLGAGTSADIAAAFRYAGANGADVVNASFGSPYSSKAVSDAIASAPNTLFVAAAGNEANDNDANPMYPCSYSHANVICVAATDRNDALASFSNKGATTVDLGAPGVSILSTYPSFVTAYGEGFESDISSTWSTGGSKDTWGRALDGYGHYLADSPGSDYASGTDSWARPNAAISIGGMQACRLVYSMRLATRVNDALVVEASDDGQTWRKITGWSGSTQGGWDRISSDLSGFDGAASVHIRLRFVSDALLEDAGADLDDLSVQCLSTSYSGGESVRLSGTSMAAPHVAGAAALVWARRPAASIAAVKDALLRGTDPKPSLQGATASGGRLNLVGALEIIAPGSVPHEEPAPVETPTPEPEPTESPTPEPTEEATPEPEPTESPTTEPSPEPEATPEPDPGTDADGSEGEPPIEHDRKVSLRLRRHLVVEGRVRAPGAEACRAHVVVRIKRGGKIVARTTTKPNGRFWVRLPDRKGRYVAWAPSFSPTEGETCIRARSRVLRHRH